MFEDYTRVFGSEHLRIIKIMIIFVKWKLWIKIIIKKNMYYKVFFQSLSNV